MVPAEAQVRLAGPESPRRTAREADFALGGGSLGPPPARRGLLRVQRLRRHRRGLRERLQLGGAPEAGRQHGRERIQVWHLFFMTGASFQNFRTVIIGYL